MLMPIFCAVLHLTPNPRPLRGWPRFTTAVPMLMPIFCAVLHLTPNPRPLRGWPRQYFAFVELIDLDLNDDDIFDQSEA